MTSVEFSPWRKFHADKDKAAMKQWAHDVGVASVEAFQRGMGNYPPASAPGAWPNSRTGKLRASIKYEVSGDNEVQVGTDMPYSIYLRYGTSKMKRRKMSDTALQQGMKNVGRRKFWVGWARG